MNSSRHLWLIACSLSLGICVSNGFARFAYGLILPHMQSDLLWNYSQAGWINTANALGYVIGAVLTFLLIRKIPAALLFASGMIATSVFVLISGTSDNFWLLTLWRILSGIFTAPVFIAGSALAAALFPNDKQKNALAIALYFGGGGLGIIISGAMLPALFTLQGSAAWHQAWLILGILSLILCLPSIWAASCLLTAVAGKKDGGSQTLPIRQMLPLFIGYGFFAAGYIVYITFVVAWMKELSATAFMVAMVWITTGLASVISPFVWRRILARYDNGYPLALTCIVVAAGTLLPLVLRGNIGLLLSAALFGIAVFIGPGAVTNFSRKNLPQESWGHAVAAFTVLFSICQTIGPVAAGAIGDLWGSISNGMFAAGVLLLLGAMVAARQKKL
ncbi:MAG: YbfB/YjiJ family MFS transporter [Proteobacteria bacterium]|nr:YbfB/YjiJ family MFS transporter [Pseudomonadota bacterium]